MEPLLSHCLQHNILIVDDMETMRSHLIMILKNLGFSNITEAINGEQAHIAAIDRSRFAKPFDIIFSDINMPVMNGLALLKNLRATEAYKKIPIFMVSNENEKSVIIKSMILGATDYILKPYQPEIVKAKLIEKCRK
jgi:two-component system chemotaxis response regulator CheY